MQCARVEVCVECSDERVALTVAVRLQFAYIARCRWHLILSAFIHIITSLFSSPQYLFNTAIFQLRMELSACLLLNSNLWRTKKLDLYYFISIPYQVFELTSLKFSVFSW